MAEGAKTIMQSDVELVKKTLNGNKESFGKLVDRYETPIRAYIKRVTNWDWMSVEDICQEVFLKAYVNLQSFDVRLKFSSWLYRIAHNQAVDFLKSHKKTQVLEEEENGLWSGKMLLEDMAIKNMEAEDLKRKMKKLDEKDREILVLYYWEEKSYEEISDILKLPAGTVGVYLQRAKKKFKVLLEEKNGKN